MRTTRLIASVVWLALALAYCGDDDESSGLNEADAQKAYGAVFYVLGQATSAAESALTQAATVDVNIDFTYQCEGGGTLDLVGTLHGSDYFASFDYDATFNGCSAQGITMDGDLAYSLDVAETQTGYDMDYSMNGDLEFSGGVEGSCDIELNMTMSNGQYEFNGEFCGQSMSASGSAY